MEKDTMLRARLTAKQMAVLDQIVAELQVQTPEASVSTSSVARYALERYIDTHIAKRDKTKLFVEINTSELSKDDIATMHEHVAGMLTKISESGNVAVRDALMDLGIAVTNFYAHSLMPKREA